MTEPPASPARRTYDRGSKQSSSGKPNSSATNSCPSSTSLPHNAPVYGKFLGSSTMTAPSGPPEMLSERSDSKQSSSGKPNSSATNSCPSSTSLPHNAP